MNEDLRKKVDRAVKLIQAAGKVAKEHGQPLEICYSGGKDSDVILELARMSGVDIRTIYKNTTIDPPGTNCAPTMCKTPRQERRRLGFQVCM